MTEYAYHVNISDIRLTTIIFDHAFELPTVGNDKMPSQKTSMHRHANYEIFFVSDGTLSIGTEQETLSYERSLVVIPPFLNHYRTKTMNSGYTINFFLKKNEVVPGNLHDAVTNACKNHLLHFPLSNDELFYLERIGNHLKTHDDPDAIPHLIWLLFSEIFRKIAPVPRKANPSIGRSTEYINKIEYYINQHCHEKIHLSDIGRELYLCDKQVTRIIRQKYGCSFSELVNQTRMTSARMLLLQTDQSIREIAAKVGYEDRENYFFTLFRKRYGITPTEYRKTAKNTQNTQ